jgi:hypothetical protein
MAAISPANEREQEKGEGKGETQSTRGRYESLKSWDDQGVMQDVPWGMTISLVGTRSSGKTFALAHIINHLHKFRKYDCVFLFSATALEQQTDALAYIPRCNKFTNLEQLPVLLRRQKEVVDHNRKLEKSKAPMKDFIRSRLAVILDDFVNFGARTSKELTATFVHGRHLGYQHPKSGRMLAYVDTFTLGQDMVFLSPVQRQNTDWVFSSAPLSYRSRKALAEGYMCTGYRRDEAYDMIQELSNEPYRFVAIHVTAKQKGKMEDFIYRCKCASELPKFKIGPKFQWKWSEGMQ